MPRTREENRNRQNNANRSQSQTEHAATLARRRQQRRLRLQNPEERLLDSTHRAERRRRAQNNSSTPIRPSAWWTSLQRRRPKSQIGKWLPPCTHCGVARMDSEPVTFCCNGGERVLPPLNPLPPSIQDIVNNNPAKIAADSRKINNLFCLTVLGVSGGFEHFSGNGPQTVTITGMYNGAIHDI